MISFTIAYVTALVFSIIIGQMRAAEGIPYSGTASILFILMLVIGVMFLFILALLASKRKNNRWKRKILHVRTVFPFHPGFQTVYGMDKRLFEDLDGDEQAEKPNNRITKGFPIRLDLGSTDALTVINNLFINVDGKKVESRQAPLTPEELDWVREWLTWLNGYTEHDGWQAWLFRWEIEMFIMSADAVADKDTPVHYHNEILFMPGDFSECFNFIASAVIDGGMRIEVDQHDWMEQSYMALLHENIPIFCYCGGEWMRKHSIKFPSIDDYKAFHVVINSVLTLVDIANTKNESLLRTNAKLHTEKAQALKDANTADARAYASISRGKAKKIVDDQMDQAEQERIDKARHVSLQISPGGKAFIIVLVIVVIILLIFGAISIAR